VRRLALASSLTATCTKRSQYRCSSSDKREAAQDSLILHGYGDVFCAGTSDTRTHVVIHPDAYGCRVDYIVHRVDPAAERIARSRMGPTPDVGDDSG
jgi:hypothetical protein